MILLDTHTLVWGLQEPELLSNAAKAMLSGVEPHGISAASLYEIAYKGGRGKWPEVENLIGRDMQEFLDDEGIAVLPVTGTIMQRAGRVDWPHRDPFDRIIVMTALAHGCALVSKDSTLDTFGDPTFRRIW